MKTDKVDLWSEIRKLSDESESEIQVTFKSGGLVKVVIDDGGQVYSFINGWNNIILESIKNICLEIQKKKEKRLREVNESLKKMEQNTDIFPDNLFDKDEKKQPSNK